MSIYLAVDLHEAVVVDGAGGWRSCKDIVVHVSYTTNVSIVDG